MASLKKCIEQKCKDCTYDHTQPGTWREQIENCTVKSCALWPVRPMTVATINLNRKSRTGTDDLNVDAVLETLEPDDEEEMVVV